MSKIYQILGLNQPEQRGDDCEQLISNDMVGLEVELERGRGVQDAFRNSRLWQATNDGSLRNDGIELIFKRPIGGDKVIQAVEQLVNNLEPTNVEVNDRTALHVHVDVRDLEPSELKVFMSLAIMFEDLFFSKTGGRTDNIFCCKFSTSDSQLAAVSSIDRLEVGTVIPDALHRVQKYASVNMKRLFDQGSIEFRYHEGTLDPDRIINWVNTLLHLKVFAKDFGQPADEILNNFSADAGVGLMLAVLGDELSEYYRSDDTADLMIKGMRLVQDAILLRRLEEDQPRIKRKIATAGFRNPNVLKHFGVEGEVKKKKPRIRADFEPMPWEDPRVDIGQ